MQVRSTTIQPRVLPPSSPISRPPVSIRTIPRTTIAASNPTPKTIVQQPVAQIPAGSNVRMSSSDNASDTTTERVAAPTEPSTEKKILGMKPWVAALVAVGAVGAIFGIYKLVTRKK